MARARTAKKTSIMPVVGDGSGRRDLAAILPATVVRVADVEQSAEAGSREATELVHRATAGALAYAATVDGAISASRAKLAEALAVGGNE